MIGPVEAADIRAYVDISAGSRAWSDGFTQDAGERAEQAPSGCLVGAWEGNPATGELLLSEAARQIVGAPPGGSATLTDLFAHIQPDDRRAAQAAFQRAIDPNIRDAYSIEYRSTAHADGLVHLVAVRGRALFDDHGVCERVVGIVIDQGAAGASAAGAANRRPALHDGELQLRAITDFAHLMVWSARPDGTPDFYSPQCYDYTGLDAETLARQEWFAVIHPDDQARAAAAWRQCLATGEAYEAEYRMRHRSGIYRWVIAHGTALRDGSGTVVRWIGTCVDIDHIVDARDALARARRAPAPADVRAWCNSADVLCVVGLDGLIRAINPTWTRLLDWTPADIVGRHLLAVHHPDDAAGIRQALASEPGSIVAPFESRLQHKDGSYRWFGWAATNDGNSLHASGRHITAAKHAAEAQARSEKLLRHNQKMEAVGQLTGGIAHDFNNLLQAISGCLETLQRRHVHSGDGVRLIQQAATAIDRGANLTRQLLAFAREQQLAPRAIDVNATLAGSCELITRSFGAAAAIDWQLGDGVWPAMADPNQLDIALLNLLLNARDAMPSGGVITVATCNIEDRSLLPPDLAAGDYIRLTVADTGVGMSDEVLARATEPFFTTKEVGRGSGLGLSQVYGFALQSGGALRISSAPGQGTSVDIILPRAPSPDAGWHPAVTAPPRPVSGTVLVVDDDFDVREQTVACLEDSGYRVLEADGGPNALRLLADEAVDLLLVDYAMPGMNGAEVVRLGRFMQPSLKVLFMTGYADIEALRPYAAPQDIIRKPFRLAALTAQVEKVLHR